MTRDNIMRENEMPNKLLYREPEWYRDAGNSKMVWKNKMYWRGDTLKCVGRELEEEKEQKDEDNNDITRVFNPYPTAFPYGNGMVLHFYQQQESSTTKTVTKSLTRDIKLMYSRLTLVRISINL